MVRMFGEKDRARFKSKRCGRWLGCLERKTEQYVVRQEMWQMVRMFGEKDRARYSKSKRCGRWLGSKSKRCGRWLGCLERKTEQDVVRARGVVDG